MPTSEGKVTDQIVLNRFVYPYLEAALHFYGITRKPVCTSTPDGDVKISYLKMVEWRYKDRNGIVTRYNDPLEFQKAHSQDSPVDLNKQTEQVTNARSVSLY